jgi:ketosteroid isomerase-like protein
MRYVLFPVLSLWVACSPGPDAGTFTPADEAAIRAVMAAQEAAWDRADVDGFMQGYADTVCFLSPRGRTCGRAEVTANYKRSYPDASAMGDLTFGVGEVVPAGADHAWMTGTWRLARRSDTLSGAFSLLWVKQAEGWRIARDHTY